MNKRNAILLGIFAIAGVVSSVWILASTIWDYPAKEKKETGIYEKTPVRYRPYARRPKPVVVEDIFVAEEEMPEAPKMVPWDNLTEEEQKLLEELGLTRETTKKLGLGILQYLAKKIKEDKGY